MNARGLYLDLLKRVLVNLIYPEAEGIAADIVMSRQHGGDNPSLAHSMIGWERMTSLQRCCERVLWDRVPGHFIEAGVWRGGACIFMRAVLAAYEDRERKVFVADSFAGLPKPAQAFKMDGSNDLWKRDDLRVSVTQVEENFRKYGLLDEQVVFVQGWFRDTLRTLDYPFSIVRLDGDMYESTMDSLKALYPRLSVGGFLLVDDYGCFEACRAAVTDYRAAHGIDEQIEKTDWTEAWWRKEHDHVRE